MPTQLPVEIIGRIIQLIYLSSSKRKAILPLLLVSPTFRIETERLLYSHICLRTLAQVVRCFHTINSRPNIPRTVRQLHISLELNSNPPAINLFDFLINEQVQRFRDGRDAKHTGKVLRPFGVLVDRTLNKLTSLQEYSLSLGGSLGRDELVFAPMWLPPQAPFKLRRFIVDLNLSPAMTRFLQSQSSITDLLAPHFSHQPNRLPLPPGSLPKLRGLVVSPEVASSIVPGRPVKRVVLKPPRRGNRIIESTLSTIPFLAQSSIPVKSIDIVVPQPSVTAELLLRPLAAGLPHLEHIILRRGFVIPHDLSVYDTYESDAFTGALADFRNLKTLQVPAPSALHHLKEAGILNEMIDVIGGPGITIQANINGQIFPGPPPPPPPVLPMAPVFGPPLPPNFPNPNGNENDDGDLGPAPGPGAGLGGGIQGIGGALFAIPLGGGFLGGGGGGMMPPLPPLFAGQVAGNAGNPPPPPPPAAGGPGAGLPAFFQNLFGFDQPPHNPNANGNGNEPPAPVQGPAPGPNFDDIPALMDDPGEGEVVADFFVVTAGPMEGEGGNPNEQDAIPEGQEPQPPQGDADPLAQPAGPNGAPLPLNLNQVLNQATNMIMQQLQNHLQAQLGGIMAGGPGGGAAAAGGPANPNPAAPPANANAGPTAGANGPPGLIAAVTPHEADDDFPPLGPIDILEPLANLAAAGAAPPPPPPPPGPAAPLNFQTTFVTAWDPVTGQMVPGPDDPNEATPPTRPRTRDFKDPKVVEILDKAQRELKPRELKILDKWKLGGYAPGLKTVMFDMEPTVRRRTIWTWNESTPSAPQPTSSRLTTVSDGDDDGDVQIRNMDGDEVEANSSVGGEWGVEYVDKGVY